ncbi:type VII secretion target [Mycolicibacterium sp. XJ1819]
MLVDPEVLRAFAGQVSAASEGIQGTDVGAKATTSADGLVASTTQWAMRLVGEHLRQQANAIATNVDDMGAAVRGAGDRYEVVDGALAGTFDGLF